MSTRYECKLAYFTNHPEEGAHLIWYDNSFFPSGKEYDFADWVEMSVSEELSMNGEMGLLAPGLYKSEFDVEVDYDVYTGETDVQVLFGEFILENGY